VNQVGSLAERECRNQNHNRSLDFNGLKNRNLSNLNSNLNSNLR
jgi:hypothetical protein